MPNQLTSPPAPNPQPQERGRAGANFNPAPTATQTVASLRHFMATNKAIRKLLQNPDCGKADIKSSVIDAATKLVAQHIFPASQAVTLLGQFPERPFEQKQWLEQQFSQSMQAQVAVLSHHAQANPGTPDDLQSRMNDFQDTSDNHQETMAGMMRSHYGMK